MKKWAKKIAEHPIYLSLVYLVVVFEVCVFFITGNYWLLIFAGIIALSNTMNLYSYWKEKDNVVGR